MATYRMTPQERLARAKALTGQREAIIQYRRDYAIQKDLEERQRARIAAEKAEIEDMNWFVRGLSTIGDIVGNIITGAIKGLEGIYDFGAGLVGAVGGLFSDDFQDDVQDHISYDWTSEAIGNPVQEWMKYSYTENGGIVESVASGVGQILPAVIVSVATAGAGAPAAVAQIASIATTATSAAGNATESAYNDGASYYGGLGYGVASGLVEAGTEKLFGGATKGIFGKGMLDNAAKSIADTGIKRIAKRAVEEGIEEVAAEVVNPALKSIYKGKSAFSEYGDGEYWKGVGKAGVVGSLTALGYSGTVGYGLSKVGIGYSGKEADINDSLHEIEGQKKKANNLFADDRLSDENAARITQNLQGNYQNIEKTLKKATPEKRASLIKKFSLESAFEADGTMKADFASTLDITKQAEAITESGVNGSENAIASLDRRYVSPDLIGQKTKINEALSASTEGLRKTYMKEHNATYEQAVEAVKDITAFKNEFTEKGKTSYSKFKKGLNYLNRISGHNVNLVVVDEHDSFNANIVDDTIYIGADTFENDTWARALVHEYTHFAEGTKEYAKLVRYLRENQELSEKALKDVFGKGYVSVEEIEKLYDKFEKGEELTADERQALTTYESELGAHLTENLLGNESFIDKLVGKDTKLAEKVLNKIADLKKMFERVGNAEARAEYKQIKKAEKLYLGAVEKAGYAYINRKIVAARKKEELDKNEEIQYNRKYFKFLHKNFPDERVGIRGVTTAHRIALDWARNAKTGDQALIFYKNHWYKVEKFDDSLNNYQVEEFITVAEFNKISKEIEDYGRSGKIKSIQGRVDWIDSFNRQSYSLKRREQGFDSVESRYGREDNQVQRLDKNQVKRRERPSSDGDGDSSGGGANKQGQPVSFSLKESVEKDVLAYYGSTYRWAETGYIFKDGTRLDLSGRRDGASGGRRTVDHRDIFDVYEDIDGGEAMIEFMSRGNIRVSPENPGINLQVEPTAEQYRLIQDMVERLGWKEEYFSVDFDDSNGDTVESLTYEGKVSARKVVADIKYYFKEGKLPYQSELSQFRYSLKDSQGRTLTEEQAKFFADSQVRDKDGNLLVVYHGTEGEFFTFDKALRGSVTGTRDAKLGFFFTSDKEVALEYAIEALDTKYFNLRNKIANGNREVLRLLTYVGGYKELAATEDVKEYGRLQDKSERYENDIMELYLNITNPLIEDWKGQPYKKTRMLKLVTRALQGDYDGVIVKNIDDTIDQTGENISDVFVAFEPNQIKSTSNKKPTLYNDDIRYSLKADINDYTEKQYNDFGWARVNGVLSYRENADFRSKYAKIKSGQVKATRTKNGEIIVAVNDGKEDSFGVDNVLVYAKGSVANYKINKIVKINLDNETSIEIVRSKIYEIEADRREYTYTAGELIEAYFGQEVVSEYAVGDFSSYQELKTERRRQRGGSESGRVDENYQREQDGIGNLGENQGDTRFSLKDKYFYRLTDGQVKKAVANYTKFKVYSKVDAESIINSVLASNYMSFKEKYGFLANKSKKEVIEMLWRGLNTAEQGKQAKVALDIAEYIIQNSVLENLYEEDSNQIYIDTIQVLKPYLHSINLSGIKGDIKHKYDKDNSPYALWGKRKEHGGKGADVIAMELEEEGFYIDGINEADIFFQIDTAYREAVAALKNQAKELLDSNLTKEERNELKQKIAKEVLRGFDYQGKPSKLADIVKTYSEKAKAWKEKYYDERNRNTVVNRLLDSVQKIKDIKLGTFLNATQFESDTFKHSIEKLSNIKYRGDLNKSGVRKIVAGLQKWYSEKNPMLENSFDADISFMLEWIATGEGDLTTNELRALADVVDYFKHFIENYNKVYRNGKYVEAQPIAEKYVGILRANKNIKVGWIPRIFDKAFNNEKASYLQTFADPMTVARYMDMYDDGFYTEMLSTIRNGAVKAQIAEMEMRAPIEEFFKKHKKYLQSIEKRKVSYLDKEIPVREALTLYMTLGREQALAGLAESGFEYVDGKETVRVKGFAAGEELTLFELIEYGKLYQEKLASQFTEADMEYIGIARNLFNEVCRDKKKETDLLRRGYTNIAEGEYVPIRRANISHSVDTASLEFELNRVSNASFNKDTVKGAKNELFIEPLDRVLDRHIRGIAQYANLSLAIDEYNKLYSLDVGGNPNKTISVKTEGKNTWVKGEEYFKKLISDIQGIPATKGDGLRAVSYIRGSYAKYQLGANPKVWLTQLSSFGAAGSILDFRSIIKGMAVKTGDVDEYCALAKLRNNDNTAAMAQGVLDRTVNTGKAIDKVNKAGDLLMKPIGMVDRFVIKKLFGACQVQVEKNNGLKVGTEENKVKAGELLKKVILETQQNSMATERSAAMRSGSELMRTITMFSADSMKVIGRVVDSVGELSVLKTKRKAATDPNEIAKLDKKIKAAKKKVVKSTAALATTAVFMAFIAQLFRWLYNKDDEDDNVAVNMTVDAAGNLLGGLPLIRDIYARFAEGYDISDYTYSALNDLLDSGYNIFAMVGDIFSGEADSQTVAKNIKNLFYAGGQILGLPTRNVYNMAYGLTKRFSPETAYKIDSWFYDQNYSSDLAKAIENEDDEMIATIVGIMLDENIGGVENSSVRKELDGLTKKGFKVLPRSVGDSITYEGEKIALTSGQAKSFKEVYSIANEALASLVGLSQYESATDEVKAKAINFIWDIYYNLAIEEVLGVDIESKAVLFAEAIDIEKLAIIIATAQAIEADTDESGKSISGTRKAKIQKYIASLRLTAAQKYMIMGYLGYSNKNGESQVKAYINRLNLSKAEKEQLLSYSGY